MTAKRLNHEEITKQLEADKVAAKARITQLMLEDMLDEDGYPSEAALEIVRIWHWTDPKGWFEFIKSIWHLKSWGWDEGEEPGGWNNEKKVYQYHISTAGWSGNESIIREMQKNDFMWSLNWVQSRRGGHYIFELREFTDD
jgi:hypothetical protein